MEIQILDTNFQGMAGVTAVYLVIGPQGPVLIETGPASTIPTIVTALAKHGYAVADIRQILLTHIHLDHAGAAGWWAQQGARIYVHPIGAPHLVDPSRLLASAGRIYGDRMEQLWGQTVQAPAGQVTAVSDGETIQAGGLSFTALETPGHASHHHAYRLGNIGFTGDAAGVCLPRTGLLSLPAPPPEFHFELWQNTVTRLELEKLEIIYPTHFGPLEDVAGHLNAFRAFMAESVEFVAKLHDAGAGREEILAAYVAWNHERARLHGAAAQELTQEELANPLQMSVDGILRYLGRKARR
jgi:glyoxylase-like metal-dependent hydrolase (beta-lactamase superfamily II)